MKNITTIILLLIITINLTGCIDIQTTKQTKYAQNHEISHQKIETKLKNEQKKYAGAYNDDDVIYQNEHVTIIKRGFDHAGGQYGPEVKLYIINNSNNEYLLQTRDFKVNGIEVTPILSKQINPKEKDTANLIIWCNDLRTHSISLIETIEFSFFFLNNHDLDNPYQTETITLIIK